jgi:hypothetical protein
VGAYTALAQIDGIGLNTPTLAVVTTIVLGLVGTITFLFKWATARQDREIARLEQDKQALESDNQHLIDTLIDVLRTTHRSMDAADEATQELIRTRRTGRRPKS